MSLKKNLEEAILKHPKAEIFFSDESRFGTHSKIGYGWYKKGSRSPVSVKLGYKNFYLYGAANPSSGENFQLILPNANTECMSVFLKEFSIAINGKKVILVIDGAGWHKAKCLDVPANITLVFLPPYSPELNPIERLWLYIKQHILKNRIYKSIIELEEALCNFINNMDITDVASICSTSYLINYK